ncbi:hypothetical protein BJ944DRAFT_262917 [Cunninghamella echinulata]|nr:hypothetical protein BJ944DRAFT_262917 [Cunninghamella echinulata]
MMKNTIVFSLLISFYTTIVFAMYGDPYDPYDYYDPYYNYEMDLPNEALKIPYERPTIMRPPSPYRRPYQPYMPSPPPLAPPQTIQQDPWNNFVNCYLQKCINAEETCFKTCLNGQGSTALNGLNPPGRASTGGSDEENEENDDEA